MLTELRDDFERRSRRSLSLPIAGAVVWTVVALLIARLRGEQLIENTNPLARLMGACAFMVNLLWALHIPLALNAPAFVPLSVGVGLGLHWVVYSWITQHPVGYAHATLRTVGVLAAWWMFPQAAVSACAVAVVAAYALAIGQMATRRIPTLDAAR